MNFLFKDIFAKAFETSNVPVAHPYSLSCWTVSLTVLGESKNLLVSKIFSFDLISVLVIYFGSLNSGSNVSASSKYSKPCILEFSFVGVDSYTIFAWFSGKYWEILCIISPNVWLST